MGESSKAVFLSYASQDAAAVERIAEALRAAGVEVWFDRNELVGGDAWDAKIRGQIASCALFVPVISAATQARLEGYFRIEWKLAAQRTHAMAEEKTFLLPVVIDDTRDAEAKVPAEFKAVQWTRLAAGEGSAAFCARVKTLLEGTVAAEVGNRTPTSAKPAATKPPGRGQRWFGIASAAVFAVVLLGWWQPWEQGKTKGPVAASTAGETTGVAAMLERVRATVSKVDVSRAELELAEEMLAQAAKVEPGNAAIFAAWARVDCRFHDELYDTSAARKDAAHRHAAQAASVAPQDFDVRLAGVIVLRQLAEATALGNVKQTLEQLHRERPDDGAVLFELAWNAHWNRDAEGALAWLAKGAARPEDAARAHFARGLMRTFDGDFAGGLELLGTAVAKDPRIKFLLWKSYLEVLWLGDPALARRTLAQVPPEFLLEDMPASAKFFAEMRARDYAAALATVRSIPRDYLESGAGVIPTGYYRGLALHFLERRAAAESEWQAALAAVEKRLVGERNDWNLLLARAALLSVLGRTTEAAEVWRTTRELHGDHAWGWLGEYVASHQLPPEELAAWVRQRIKGGFKWYTAAELRLNPVFDRVRDHAAFKALQAELDADPRYSPAAAPISSGKSARNDTGAMPASPAAAAPDKSVAVLAFANRSDDKANEYFSDGISEELLNVLAKIPDLKVSARTSAFHFKGKDTPIPEIAKQLGVAYVVEGSVRKAGTQVRITAQLIKAADGFRVWGDTFTRELKDIFAVQDEIAGLIAKSLELTLAGRSGPAREIAPEAYQHYLSGRAAVAKAGMADLRQAVTYFERAVAKEPTFAAAWVQLAAANTQLGRWGGLPTREAWPAARTAINRARELDPESPDVWLALGWILRTADWDWRGAERALRRAMALRPNHPDTLSAASVLLFNLGQQEEAFRLARQAAKLDPLNPATQIDLSLMFFFSESWAEAEQAARRALQLSSAGHGYHAVLAWSLIVQKRFAEGEAQLALEHSEVERLNGLGMLALGRGQTSVARGHLARLEQLAESEPDRADLQQSIAWLCAGLGEVDRAFAALEKAVASRDPSVSWSRTMWPLRRLYDDPRWVEFLRKVGLADDQLK